MKGKRQLIGAILLAVVVSGGVYAFTYLSATATVDVTVIGAEIATVDEAAAQPDWNSILTPVVDAEIFRPNTAGTYTELDPRGAVTYNWECVDEEVADEDSTWLRANDEIAQQDTFNIPDHSEGAGTIISVTVHIRCRGTTNADLHAAETLIRTHDTNYYGTYTLLPLSYTDYSTAYTTNPNTTSAWTWDEVDALEIGVRLHDNGGGVARCTQVYVNVIFAAPPLTGDVPTGNLFDITPDTNYTGDLAVRVYLTNTGALAKAYQELNMELKLEGSVEYPGYQLLTLENGWVTFNLKDYAPGTYTLSVTGGDYSLVSRDTSEWQAGWTVIPELYCQIFQRGE